jgi:mannose/fructose/N-acetylgalactosamine-specific phosphotransferase system component IIC
VVFQYFFTAAEFFLFWSPQGNDKMISAWARMRMPANSLELLGVIGSVLTIISFALYLKELCKRKLHDTLVLGFLHGLKSRDTITSADWQPLCDQIDDILSRLQPPKKQDERG